MRKFMMAFLAFLVIALPINGAFTNTANAASTRVAVIKELKGTVKVKKAGGAKEFTAFAKMSLNEGDVLSVGNGGSAMLQFANGTSEDDKMTVSANTRLSFSKLSSKKGTTTKVSMWSGNAWVDVKSIASANDEFTLETPTAVMGVRGTHFFVNVNPLTGATNMTVAAGIVRTSPNGNATAGKQPTQNVYPAQQVLVSPTQQGQADLLKGPIDINQIVSQSSPDIIKAFLLSAPEIVAENNALMNTYLSQISVGNPQQDQKRVRDNIENIVGAIASNTKKDSQLQKISEIQEAIDKLTQLLGKDINDIELTLTEDERDQLAKIGEFLNILQKQAEEMQKQEQLKRDKELQAQLLKKQEEQKKAVEEEIKKKKGKAYDQYESQLDELEKERLRRDRDKRLQESATPTPSTSTGNGSSGNPGPSPSESSQAGTLTSLRIIKYVGEASPPVEPPPSSTTIDLSPTFNSSTLNYSAQAASNVSYVYIRPVAANTSDTLTVNGSVVASGGYRGIPLNIGNNDVTIVVTASGGTTKTYTVSINRTFSGRLASISGLDLDEPFNPDVIQYTGYTKSSEIFLIPESGSSITVKLNDANLEPSGSITRFVPSYVVGPNKLEVTVTPEFGEPTKYTFNLTNLSVVEFGGLTSTRFIFESIDRITYSGILPSEYSEFNLTVGAYNPDSKVELFKDSVKKGEGTFYSLTGLTEGWNVYQIHISDNLNRVDPQDYTLQIWRGNASWIDDWIVRDNHERPGQVDFIEPATWDIRYASGATSLSLKPLTIADSPFTVHSIELSSGSSKSIYTPDSSGYITIPVSSGYSPVAKLRLMSDGKFIVNTLLLAAETPDLALTRIETYYENEYASPRVPEAYAVGDEYYIMAEQLPNGGTIELSAIGNESNQYEWYIGESIQEQNEESEDHVEATPSGLEAYRLKVTDLYGRSAWYTVYVYQGLPDAGLNLINWDSIDKQWVMEAYLDLDGKWSTSFDLRLLPDITASFVNTSGITYDPETMTLSGQYSEEDEVYVDIRIPLDSGMTATYRLKIYLYPSS